MRKFYLVLKTTSRGYKKRRKIYCVFEKCMIDYTGDKTEEYTIKINREIKVL